MSFTREHDNVAITVTGLNKSFGHTKVLDGLNLKVEKGQIAGFLGPNGSGKSTTLRILLGLLRADSGQVKLLGADPWHDSVTLHSKIAYVPGEVTLWPQLTGGQIIETLANLRPDSASRARQRQELIERFELDPSKKARAYSKGNRQKVALISALASNAEVLIFDEPTSGLDPLMENIFQECVREQAQAGTSVLLSSHILAEVEKLCNAITIIRSGRTVQSGSLDELRHLLRNTVVAQTRAVVHRESFTDGVYELVSNGHEHEFTVDSAHLDSVILPLINAGIVSLSVTPASLEKIFLHEYDQETRSS